MGLVLKIGSDEFSTFTKGEVNLKYGYISSSFSLTAVFDPENALHRRIFKPLSYPEVTLYTDKGKKLITGTILNHKFNSESKKKVVTISGYSKTGILSDCKIPVESYPLEFNGLTLVQIATQLLEPFGIGVVVENDGGVASEVIAEVTANEDQTISAFLKEIANQRNLIITHDGDGNIVFTRTRTNVPSIATYRESIPATQITLSVKGQGMHSSITAMKQSDLYTENTSEGTIENELVGLFRPTTMNQKVGTDNTVDDVVRNQRANELRNIGLVIDSDRWEWLNFDNRGIAESIEPNNIIDVISPDNWIPNRTQFFVESVKLISTPQKDTSTLSCVLPEVYNNQDPQIIFRW